MTTTLNNSNIINHPSPQYMLMSLGEASASYLYNECETWTSVLIKVASFVLTLGIFPAVALMIFKSYSNTQSSDYKKLCDISAQSFEGAMWVAQNIQKFRLRCFKPDSPTNLHPVLLKADSRNYPYLQIVSNVWKQIEENFQKCNAESANSWITKLSIKRGDYLELFISMMGKACSPSVNSQPNKEFEEKGEQSNCLNLATLNNFGITTSEDISFVLLHLATLGAVPTLKNLEEMYKNSTFEMLKIKQAIVEAMLGSYNMDTSDEFKFDFILDCMSKYQITGKSAFTILDDYLRKDESPAALPFDDVSALDGVNMTSTLKKQIAFRYITNYFSRNGVSASKGEPQQITMLQIRDAIKILNLDQQDQREINGKLRKSSTVFEGADLEAIKDLVASEAE